MMQHGRSRKPQPKTRGGVNRLNIAAVRVQSDQQIELLRHLRREGAIQAGNLFLLLRYEAVCRSKAPYTSWAVPDAPGRSRLPASRFGSAGSSADPSRRRCPLRGTAQYGPSSIDEAVESETSSSSSIRGASPCGKPARRANPVTPPECRPQWGSVSVRPLGLVVLRSTGRRSAGDFHHALK